MKSIGNMIKALDGLLDTNDMTTWEQDFVRTASANSNGGRDTTVLSEKDVELVDTIYRSHFS